MSKKILFVGAGTIGSYIGAFLSRAGHDVTLVDAWAEQVETIRRQGIAVTGPHDPLPHGPRPCTCTRPSGCRGTSQSSSSP